MIATVVWGTGNVGRAAIRAVEAHPGLEARGGTRPRPRQGRPRRGRSGRARPRPGGRRHRRRRRGAGRRRRGAVVYAASGDIRPDDALADIVRAIRAGAVVVVTPRSTRSTTRATPRRSCGSPCSPPWRRAAARCSSPASTRAGATTCCRCWSAGSARPSTCIRCQEIFDYSTYDQPEARSAYLVGMGQPMDYEPPMLAPTVPTMVWGGQVRLMARALGVELDEIRETLDRRPLEPDGEHADDGRVRGRHPGRGAVRGAGHRRGRAPHRHRARHPHPPVVRPGLAACRPTATGPTG